MLRGNQRRVVERLAALAEWQELIGDEVRVHGSRLADGTAARLRAPVGPG